MLRVTKMGLILLLRFVTDGTYKTVQDISVTLRDLDEEAPVITSAQFSIFRR